MGRQMSACYSMVLPSSPQSFKRDLMNDMPSEFINAPLL